MNKRNVKAKSYFLKKGQFADTYIYIYRERERERERERMTKKKKTEPKILLQKYMDSVFFLSP